MKLFDVAWTDVLGVLPRWEGLPREVRLRLLELFRPSGTASPDTFGAHLAEIREMGVLVPATSSGSRLGVAEEFRPLFRVLRAVYRHRLWDDSAPPALVRYLEEHFSVQDLQGVLDRTEWGWGWGNRQVVAQRVTAEEWVEGFLDEEAEKWERKRLRPGDTALLAGERGAAAQRLVREILRHPQGVPLRELPEHFVELDLPLLGAALHAALHYLLLYAGTDAAGEARVGVWPRIAQRLNRAPVSPPQPVAAEASWHAAWLLEDLTTVLVAAVAEPLRLRGNDFALFARTRQAIGARLLALPPWLPQEIERDADERADEAAFLLRGLRFAEARGEPGEDLRLVPTRKGTRWLAGSDRERLAALVDPLRKSPQRNPPSWYAEDREWNFFPLHFDLATSKSRWDLRSALTERFLSTPAEEWVPLDAFLEHARREANPFLARGVDRSGATRGGRLQGRAEWERLWGEMVRIFLFARLAPLGGVRLGRTAEGEFCFTLAEVGRYLLGAADTFEYGYTGEAEVVVQPNFEVVFLTPSPQLEAQLARFAERVGSGVGVLFRITRASVLAAAEAGGDAEGLLGTLRGASSRALPENVERQIRDWLAAVRRVTTRRVLLVECPDAETAARVHAASGGSIRPITPTVLEAPDSTSKARTALVRRLRKAGVFVAE